MEFTSAVYIIIIMLMYEPISLKKINKIHKRTHLPACVVLVISSDKNNTQYMIL